MAWCDVVEPRTLRACRIALGQSQAAFAATLGASPESYRTWDAGRRATPLKILARARALAAHRDDHAPSASRRSAAQVQLSTILPTLTTLVLGYRHNRGSTVEERGQPQCEP